MKIYSVHDGGNVLLIAPVKRISKTATQIFGSKKGFDFVDVLYADDKPDSLLKAALVKFLQCLADDGFASLEWDFLDSQSRSKRFLSEIFSLESKIVENVRIPLFTHKTFSAYTASLSKNVRQNIRTAYNRLSRDNHTMKAGAFFRDELRQDEVRKILAMCDDVYIARQASRYDSASLLKRFTKRFLHYASQIPRAEEGFCSFIMVDGEVAAFMYGYDNRRIMSVEIPRLAINDKFRFYSPGLILVNETVKMLMEKGYRYLDLCRGTEKYKFDMGGEKYTTENFVLDITPLRQ